MANSPSVKARFNKAFHDKLHDAQILISATEAEKVSEILFNTIGYFTLDLGENVQFKNYCTFKPQTISAHAGRNPSTGETVEIPTKTKVKMTLGPKSKFRISGEEDMPL